MNPYEIYNLCNHTPSIIDKLGGCTNIYHTFAYDNNIMYVSKFNIYQLVTDMPPYWKMLLSRDYIGSEWYYIEPTGSRITLPIDVVKMCGLWINMPTCMPISEFLYKTLGDSV